MPRKNKSDFYLLMIEKILQANRIAIGIKYRLLNNYQSVLTLELNPIPKGIPVHDSRLCPIKVFHSSNDQHIIDLAIELFYISCHYFRVKHKMRVNITIYARRDFKTLRPQTSRRPGIF